MKGRAEFGSGLPVDLPVLIGRQHEIEAVARLVERCRLVTLTGPTGIGKTRIGIEVARHIQNNYPSRVALVELAPIADPGLVAQSVGAAYGLEPQPARDPLDALVAELQPLTALIVLDNCEHVLEAAGALVDRLLADCGGVSVLATSQRPLGITGEQVHPVPALSVPEAAAVSSPEQAVAESDAVALFCVRAAAIDSRFSLTDEAVPAVVQICRRLGGIPLAIELAAARVGVLGADDIAQRLDRRFRLLTKGSRSSPPRHQILRAAIDWSYELLSAPEATLLRRLSAFAGGAPGAALAEVVTDEDLPPDDIGSLLESLVARSLVSATSPETVGTSPRYRLLETIRAYGRERLDESGEATEVCRRHALWCIERAERLAAGDGGGESWVADLEIDYDNVRAALAWSIDNDAGVALRLAVALVAFWEARGYFSEGQRWLSQTLAATVAAGYAAAPPPELRAEALWGMGLLATVRGDMDTARPAVEQALSMARAFNLPSQAAKALNLLGLISIFTQEPLRAKPMLEEALSLARDSAEPAALAGTLLTLGRACLFLGDIDQARQLFEECLGLRTDDPGAVLSALGRTALAAGHDALAEEHLDAAVASLRGPEPYELALALSYLGEAAWARGDIAKARPVLEEGLELARSMAAPYPASRCLWHLANVARTDGEPSTAMALAREANTLALAAHLPYARVRCLHVRGVLRRAAGDFEGARQDVEEALALATENGDRQGRALSLGDLAGVLRALGEEEEAVALVQEAIGIEAEIGGGGLPGALEALAAIRVDQDRPALGATLFGAAEALRTSEGTNRRPDEIAGYEADLADLRRALKDRQFRAAWARGAELARAEVVALAGDAPMPRGLHTTADRWADLTPSEARIATMVTEGMSSRQIAERLGISERTVHGHVGRALKKLHFSSRHELKNLKRNP